MMSLITEAAIDAEEITSIMPETLIHIQEPLISNKLPFLKEAVSRLLEVWEEDLLTEVEVTSSMTPTLSATVSNMNSYRLT